MCNTIALLRKYQQLRNATCYTELMKHILFATGNSRKISEANETLKTYEIIVKPVKVETDEIQHHDPAEITKAKARSAYEFVHEPVVVSDTS